MNSVCEIIMVVLCPVFRSYDKKAPPVSMSKLLSHGYVEDQKKSPNDDDASSTTQRLVMGSD